MVFSKFKLQFYSEISLEQTINFEEEGVFLWFRIFGSFNFASGSTSPCLSSIVILSNLKNPNYPYS